MTKADEQILCLRINVLSICGLVFLKFSLRLLDRITYHLKLQFGLEICSWLRGFRLQSRVEEAPAFQGFDVLEPDLGRHLVSIAVNREARSLRVHQRLDDDALRLWPSVQAHVVLLTLLDILILLRHHHVAENTVFEVVNETT